ncbi:MAG TPA: ABC transporter ATP-binding protein [Paenalcaligenes sp.]|nr:ABC transporter ATP-binding protein [Paenalcaligenes sp.]
MLRISDLVLAYGEGAPVLEDVHLTLAAGQFMSLIGPSGCGKSTLLRVVMGLQTPAQGQVELAIAADQVGFLFQDDALLPWRNARDNVALGLRARGETRAQARERAESWLESVGLGGLGDRYPSQLSGGQRKRVSIAQVLALRPKLLLMDEPFASLDAIVRRYMIEDLLAWVENDAITVLMVTHDLNEAVSVSDQVALMGNGPRAQIKSTHTIPASLRRALLDGTVHPEQAKIVGQLWHELSLEIDLPRGRKNMMANAA